MSDDKQLANTQSGAAIENAPPRERPKVGLALGSGAFRGLAHIGVLEVLLEHSIPIDYVAGCSMGAIVGGVFCCGFDVHMMHQLICSINERDYYDTTIPRTGFIRGVRVEQLIMTLTGGRTFDQTRIPFAAVAVDVEQGELVVMREGKLYEAMRASASVPGVFEPYRWQGRLMVDGAVLCRVPVETVRDMGADVVIGVDVGARSQPTKVGNIVDIMLRSMELMEWESTKNRLNHADIVLMPDVYRMSPWKLDTAEECVQIGRRIALEHIDEIKAVVGMTLGDDRDKNASEGTPGSASEPAD